MGGEDSIFLQLAEPATVWVGATLVALVLAVRRAERAGLDTAWMFAAGVAGVVGAWMGGYGYTLVDTPYRIVAEPGLLAGIVDGPKAAFGALLGGGLAGSGVLWMRGERVGAYADAAAPALALGYALYRVGCLWNGCETGAPTTLPWAVGGPLGEFEHPVAAYHAVAGLGLYLGLRRRTVGDGTGALLAVGGYGLLRFGLEFARVEPVTWWGLHPGHWWSLGVVVAAAGLWIAWGRLSTQPTPTPSAVDSRPPPTPGR